MSEGKDETVGILEENPPDPHVHNPEIKLLELLTGGGAEKANSIEKTRVQTSPNEISQTTTQTGVEVLAILDKKNPLSYERWMERMEHIDTLIEDMSELEKNIRTIPYIKDKLKTNGDDLDKALIELRLPNCPIKAEVLIKSPIYLTQIRPHLLFFEDRFLKRIQGLVYLEEKLERCQKEKTSFVGTEVIEGICLRLDIAGSTEAKRIAGGGEIFEEKVKKLEKKLIDALQIYPEVQLIKCAGDEIVFICKAREGSTTDMKELEKIAEGFLAEFLRKWITEAMLELSDVEEERAKITFAIHVGVSQPGKTRISVTENGKIIVNGKGYEQAGLAQKFNKEHPEALAVKYDPEEMERMELQEYKARQLPPVSAIHFRGIEKEKSVEALAKTIHQQMALLASTGNEVALLSRNIIQKDATCVYVKLPQVSTRGNDYNRRMQERDTELHKIAEKYGAMVFFEDSESAIFLLGVGMSSIGQSPRALLLANEIHEAFKGSKIGIAYGELKIQHGLVGADVRAHTADRAARLAHYEGLADNPAIRSDLNSALDAESQGIERMVSQRRTIVLKGIGEEEVVCFEGAKRLKKKLGRVIGREEDIERFKGVVERVKAKPAKKHQLNIQSDEVGMGVTTFLEEISNQLGQAENNLVITLEEKEVASKEPYRYLRKIFEQTFSDETQFNAWLNARERTGGIGEKVLGTKQEIWLGIYKELMGTAVIKEGTTGFLSKPDVAKEYLKEMIYRLTESNSLFLICEDIESMDRSSYEIIKEILKEDRATLNPLMLILLISTGEKSDVERFDLKGISKASAITLAQEKLKIENTPGFLDSRLGNFLRDYLEQLKDSENLFNPLLVEAAINTLLSEKIVSEGQRIEMFRMPSLKKIPKPNKSFGEIVDSRVGNLSDSSKNFLKLACRYEKIPRHRLELFFEGEEINMEQVEKELISTRPPVLVVSGEKGKEYLEFNQRFFMEALRDIFDIKDKDAALKKAYRMLAYEGLLSGEAVIVLCQNLQGITTEILEEVIKEISEKRAEESTLQEEATIENLIQKVGPLIGKDAKLKKMVGALYLRRIEVGLELGRSYAEIQKKMDEAETMMEGIEDISHETRLQELAFEAAYDYKAWEDIEKRFAKLGGVYEKFCNKNPAKLKLYNEKKAYYQGGLEYRRAEIFVSKIKDGISNTEKTRLYGEAEEALKNNARVLEFSRKSDDPRLKIKSRYLALNADGFGKINIPFRKKVDQIKTGMREHPETYSCHVAFEGREKKELEEYLKKGKKFLTDLETDHDTEIENALKRESVYLGEAPIFRSMEEEEAYETALEKRRETLRAEIPRPISWIEEVNLRQTLAQASVVVEQFKEGMELIEKNVRIVEGKGNMRLLAQSRLTEMQTLTPEAEKLRMDFMNLPMETRSTTEGRYKLRTIYEKTMEAKIAYSEVLRLRGLVQERFIQKAYKALVDLLIIQIKVAKINEEIMKPQDTAASLQSKGWMLLNNKKNYLAKGDQEGIELDVLEAELKEWQATAA